MKRLSLAIIFTLAAAVWGAAAGTAHAAIIELDASGNFGTGDDTSDCQDNEGQCILGGDVVISQSTSKVLGADLTLSVSFLRSSGRQPYVLTFMQINGVNIDGNNAEISVEDPTDNGGFDLGLFFEIPTAGSFAGFTGGPLSTMSSVGGLSDNGSRAGLESGSLTEGEGSGAPAPSVPEPSSLLLMLTGIAGVSTSRFAKRFLSARTV